MGWLKSFEIIPGMQLVTYAGAVSDSRPIFFSLEKIPFLVGRWVLFTSANHILDRYMQESASVLG